MDGETPKRAAGTSKPAPDTPKPRRHYTVTDKFREAHRESLAKAREKAKHALRGYRRGDHEDDVAYQARLGRQIKPWCRNLRRAVAAHKADRSAHYASHLTHGLTAPDLDRSAVAAGEDRDELRRHIERCQQTIGGLIDDCRDRGSGFGIGDSGSPTERGRFTEREDPPGRGQGRGGSRTDPADRSAKFRFEP